LKKYASLILVFFVFGCVSQQQEQQKVVTSNGVIITSFHSDVSSIFPEESTNLNMVFENVGDFEATDIVPSLVGQGEMQVELMESPETSLRTDDYGTALWKITAQKLEGFLSDIPITIQGVLYFKYSTITWVDVGIIPPSYPNPGVSNGTTSAPIAVSVTPSSSPLRTYKTQNTLSINIYMENKGGGSTAYLEGTQENTAKSGYVEKISVRVPSDWAIIDDTWTKESDDGLSASYVLEGEDNRLRLTGGNSKSVYVPFDVPQTETAKTERVYVTVDYSYKVFSVPITVTITPLNY
jgi:hypothetical protein